MRPNKNRYKKGRNRHFNFHLSKTARKTIIFSSVLLIILLVAGTIYTYEVDKHSGGKIKNYTSQKTSYKAITPLLPAANDKEGVSIETITSPVSVGSIATVEASTNAESECTISLLVNNTEEPGLDLNPQNSGDYGTVGWTWTVGSNTLIGTWPIRIICLFHNQSAVVVGDITITK